MASARYPFTRMLPLSSLLLFVFLISKVLSLGASTDTYTWGGSYMRNGYQINHNMDPAVVGSPNFGQIFTTQFPGNFNGIGAEQIFSQPLVFTGNDGVQYVYVATTQNNVYKLNAKTGTIVASRNLHVPFLAADLDGCTDLEPTIGVTATGTIDPATGIWYLTSKTYSDQFQSGTFGPSNPPGRLNGRYYFHGIDTQSANLSDVFAPVMLDGRTFRNNPNRMFIGGNQHSRPGLVLAGEYVYTGYASHCVLYNFTGAIIGHDKQTGAVVEMLAMEGGPEPNTIRGGGVWMSGGGISYDGSGSLFFATGNGYASQLSGIPVPGRQPPSALEEAAVNAKINDDGTLSVIDFFMPWEKQQLDGADKDLGTTPLELLPTDVFTCPNVKRMGVVTGKSGKTYVLNLDNLGGYQMGANKLDNVVFVYQNENSVYAGAGVMPLGGGYIYINVIKYQTRVFKFSCDGSGNPQFTVVAYTADFNAYILGTGHGTTTSLNGQDGTGMLWVSDVEGLNLRIYNAIPPPSGGNLTMINSFNAPGITKFTRPVFGDGITYLGTTIGILYAFGSPVNLPLNCSSPYDFGTVLLKNTSTMLTITCVANIVTTVTGVGLTGDPNFKILSPGSNNIQLAEGANFKFQATFNPQTVGPLSSDVIVNTTNSVAGYSTSTPVTLKGTGDSAAPLISIGPNTVSFSVIAGQQTGGVNESSIFSNIGDSALHIQNISYSLQSETGPWITPNITSSGVQVGPFTFINVPNSIPANGQSTVIINYDPSEAGNDACFLSIASDGGNAILDVVAVAGTNPVALIEFENFDGSGWTRLDNSSTFTFGNVTENQIRNLRLRVTNNGSVNAVPLSITVSKPPYGVQGIVGAVNNIDLAEGTILAAGQNATATLFCSVPKSQVNLPAYSGLAQWVMNTGDPNLGKQFMNFTCNAVAEQVGPLFNNGSARYGYIGCFRENNPGRQLAVQAYGDATNTNNECISTCASAGWIFAATQYQMECWCGDAIPITQDTEQDCNYVCSGNANQTCGGDGYFGDHSRMSLFADLTQFKNDSSPPLAIPPSVGQYNYIGCYAEKGGKAMNSQSTVNTKLMTVESCALFCSGFPAFSLEFAQECYCGSAVNSAFATLTSDSNCMTMTCKGNNSEFCGAGNYGQVYALNGSEISLASISSHTAAQTATTSTSATPIPSLSLANYTYLGCFNETHDRRALNDLATDTSTNTLNSCAAFCQGFHYFGVEYSSQCYCANVLYVNSIKQSTDSGCSMACAGNSSQFCGGPDFLNVYYTNSTSSSTSTGASAPTATGGPSTVSAAGGFNYIGCYNEVGGRALTGTSASNSSITVELCASFCSAYQFFSVEYSSECYCGNVINSGSVASTSGSCTMTCAANPNEYCGGSSWMNMYQRNGTIASSSSGGSVTASGTSSATSALPSSSGILGFTSLGCWTDNVGGRALANLFASNSMTLDLCASTAKNAGASYFGVEYGSECWYGTVLSGTNAAAPSSDCSFTCPGNSAELCGAGNRLSLYQAVASSSSGSSSTTSITVTSASSSTLSSTSASTTAVPTRIGNYTSLGCWTDNASGRALANQYANDSMTLELCASQASTASAQYFGVEYGRECWYSSGPISGSNVASAQSNCNMKCPGNQFEWCGAGNFLQMYNFSLAAVSSSSSATSQIATSSSNLSSTVSTISTSSRALSSQASVASSSNSGSSGALISFSSSTSSGISSSAASPTSSASLSIPSSTTSSLATSSASPSTSFVTSSGLSGVATTSSSSTATSSTTATSSSSSSLATSSASSSSVASFSPASSTLPSSTSSRLPSSSSSLPSSSSSLTSTTSSPPTPLSSISTYTHRGCYNETTGRTFNATTLTNSTGMSVPLCASYCAAYAYFGVEYETQCFCGPYPRTGSGLVADQGDCNMPCVGDKTQLCGAGNRLNAYYSSDQGKVSKDPASPLTVGNYTFYNCVIDSPRLLATRQTSSNMTVESCLSIAEAAGYTYAGLEYGQECWMGNTLLNPSTNATAGACNMVCPGNVGEICGAGSRLSLYVRG